MVTAPKLVPLAGVSIISLTNKERLYQKLLEKFFASRSHSLLSGNDEGPNLVDSIQEIVYISERGD